MSILCSNTIFSTLLFENREYGCNKPQNNINLAYNESTVILQTKLKLVSRLELSNRDMLWVA